MRLGLFVNIHAWMPTFVVLGLVLSLPCSVICWKELFQNDVFQCQVGCNKLNHSHTRPFNGPLSGTTWVSRYQKGKTNLWRQLGHMQVCTSLQTDNHASTPPLSFLQAICSCAFINKLNQSPLPLVLWHCWLGGRKGIRSVKNWVVGCWHGYLSAARCRLAYGPADATATHCLLLQ